VSWIVTSYNAAVAVTALALVFVVQRLRARFVFTSGLLVFVAATIACAVAQSLWFLIAARALQGAGAGLLLTGALAFLPTNVWTLAGTFGAALGPALGGVLTQLFDWRAIFVAQAPVAVLALAAAVRSDPAVSGAWHRSSRRTVPANACLGLVFGALVGALFLGVLLVIVVWQYTPIEGALIVSALPLAAVAVRALPRTAVVAAGAALLAVGLVALAFLPSANVPIAICALALCGAGLGLAVPALSNEATGDSAALTIGIRHVGLVVAIASIAPLLASTLPPAGDTAMLKATAVLLDAPIRITDKVPIALDLRRAFNNARDGEIPNLKEPFDSRGAQHDSTLAAARDDLVSAIQTTITRAFRWAFILAAAFAAVAAVLAWRLFG